MSKYLRYNSKLVLSRKPELSSSSAKLMYYAFYLFQEAGYRQFEMNRERALEEIRELNNRTHKDIVWDSFIENIEKMYFFVPEKNGYLKVDIFEVVEIGSDNITLDMSPLFSSYLRSGDYWLDTEGFCRLPCYPGCYSVYIYERLRYEYCINSGEVVYLNFSNSELLLSSGHVNFYEEKVRNGYENMMDEEFIYTEYLRKSENFKLFAPRMLMSRIWQPALDRINGTSGIEFTAEMKPVPVPKMKKQINGVMIKLSPSSDKMKLSNVSAQTIFNIFLILNDFDTKELADVLIANEFNETKIRTLVEENRNLSKKELYDFLTKKSMKKITERFQKQLENEWNML